MMRKPLYISIAFFIVLDVVTTALVIQKLYFDNSQPEILRSSAAIEFDEMIALDNPTDEPDEIYIANFVPTVSEHEGNILKMTGIITLHNDQQVGAEEVIVTLQLVDNAGPTLKQTVTNKNGDGQFSFDIVPGNWRVEVLDILGDGYIYESNKNVLDVYTGRFEL